MKVSDVILLLIIAVVIFVAGRVSHPPGDRIIETVTDTLTVYDTILYYRPIPRDSVVIRYVTQTLASVSELDKNVLKDSKNVLKDTISVPKDTISVPKASANVLIPITQKHYKGKDYEAWVSGYKPNLDKIIVYPETKYISANTTIKPQPKRWGIGLQVGYGFGIKENRIESSPYIGVGISYNIFTF